MSACARTSRYLLMPGTSSGADRHVKRFFCLYDRTHGDGMQTGIVWGRALCARVRVVYIMRSLNALASSLVS